MSQPVTHYHYPLVPLVATSHHTVCHTPLLAKNQEYCSNTQNFLDSGLPGGSAVGAGGGGGGGGAGSGSLDLGSLPVSRFPLPASRFPVASAASHSHFNHERTSEFELELELELVATSG
jgi:hypothetical protein